MPPVVALNSKPEALNLDQAKALGKLKNQGAGPQTPFTPSRYLTFPDDTPRTASFPKFSLDNIDPSLWSAPNSAGVSAPKSPAKLEVPRFPSSLRTEVTEESEQYLPPPTSPRREQKPQADRREIPTSEMCPPRDPDPQLEYDYRRNFIDRRPFEEVQQLPQPEDTQDHQARLQEFRYPNQPQPDYRRDYRYPPPLPPPQAQYVAQTVRDTVTPNAFGTWSRQSPSPSPERPATYPQHNPRPSTFEYNSPGPSQVPLPVEYAAPYAPLPYTYTPAPPADDEMIYPAFEGGANARQRDPISLDGTPVPPQWAGMSGYWAKGVIHTWHTGVKPSPTVFRICAQCHTDKPGAKTWRRSKLQKETTLCNKCGIYEHTHHKPRPRRHGDHQFEFSDRAHAETYAYMSTPRSNRNTGRVKVDSPGPSMSGHMIGHQRGYGSMHREPVFGVVRDRRRKPYDRDDEDWRP